MQRKGHKRPKGHFEINWPLKDAYLNHRGLILVLYASIHFSFKANGFILISGRSLVSFGSLTLVLPTNSPHNQSKKATSFRSLLSGLKSKINVRLLLPPCLTTARRPFFCHNDRLTYNFTYLELNQQEDFNGKLNSSITSLATRTDNSTLVLGIGQVTQ